MTERARILRSRSNKDQDIQRGRLRTLHIQGMETRLQPMRRLKTEATPEVKERKVAVVYEELEWLISLIKLRE